MQACFQIQVVYFTNILIMKKFNNYDVCKVRINLLNSVQCFEQTLLKELLLKEF